MKKKKLYLLDHKLKWKTFKLLQDKIVKDSGPTPVNMDKMLWQMLRDKKIYCGFREDLPNDMWVGLEVPKGFEVEVITNPKKN